MAIMNFSTQHLRNVFADENKYENFRKLCSDLNHGRKIFEYDEDGVSHEISKHEANKAIRKILMEVCELNEDTVKSNKLRKRMLKAHANEIFELIEEDIDFKVETGFRDSEWFNEFVEMRNVKLGDSEEFWTKEKIILEIAEISGDHHDLNYCRVCIA